VLRHDDDVVMMMTTTSMTVQLLVNMSVMNMMIVWCSPSFTTYNFCETLHFLQKWSKCPILSIFSICAHLCTSLARAHFCKIGQIWGYMQCWHFDMLQPGEKCQKTGYPENAKSGVPNPRSTLPIIVLFRDSGRLVGGLFFVFFCIFWTPPQPPENSDPWSVCVHSGVCVKMWKTRKIPDFGKFTNFRQIDGWTSICPCWTSSNMVVQNCCDRVLMVCW